MRAAFFHAQARLQLRKAFPSAILNNADISGRLRLCARAPWLIKLMTLKKITGLGYQ